MVFVNYQVVYTFPKKKEGDLSPWILHSRQINIKLCVEIDAGHTVNEYESKGRPIHICARVLSGQMI